MPDGSRIAAAARWPRSHGSSPPDGVAGLSFEDGWAGRSAAGTSSERPARTVRAGRALFVLALFLSVAMRGAVAPVTHLGTVVLFGTALFLGAFAPPADRRTRHSYHLSVALAAGLTLYLLLQSWSVAGNPFASQLWDRVDALLGTDVASVSVAPAATRSSIPPLVAPFLIYAAALSLFQRDAGGVALLRWLAVLGVGFAVFGLLQLAVFPDRLLFSQKTSYIDSLTGFFVNRNTAGTFLGIAGLATLTLLICPTERHRRDISALEIFGDWSAPAGSKLGALARLFGLFAILLALFLTRSRGALLAAGLAYMAAFTIHLSLRTRRRGAGARPAPSGTSAIPRPVVMVLGTGIAVLLVIGLFGELAIYRMATQGVDDVRLCVYASTIRAIGENWRFGTGFGTFEFVFPIYREAGCGAFSSLFLRAHNIYLEAALGLGLVSAPLLVGGLVHVVGNLWQGVRRRRRMRAASAIALGAVTLTALHGLVDFSLQIPGMAAYFAAYLAAATTISLGGSTRRGRGRGHPEA